MIESFRHKEKGEEYSNQWDAILDIVHSTYGDFLNNSRDKEEFAIAVLEYLSKKSRISDREGLFKLIVNLADEYNKSAAEKQIVVLRKDEYEQLQSRAVEDSLTGLYNRGFLDIVLKTEIDKAKRTAGDFSILLADVDDFKHYNDRFGHIAGDGALKRIAAAILKGCRKADQVARYGGEEFLVFMPNTQMRDALIVAERVRREVEMAHFDHDDMTISVGVASYRKGMTVNALVHGCDNALYRAKRIGKNTVCSAYDDKRFSPRLPVRLYVDLRFDSSSAPQNALKLNISKTGALISTGQNLSMDDKVLVEMKESDATSSTPKIAQARIVRSEPQNHGEVFHGLCFEDTEEAKFFADALIENLVYGRNNVGQHFPGSE